MNFKAYTISVMLLVLPFSLMGADSTYVKGRMSLRDCMEYATSNSTQVRIQQTRTGDARLDRRDAILSAFTPEVDGDLYGYYRWGRSIDPETNTYVTTTSLNNGWSVSAGITIFNGFSALNNLRIARTSISMGLSQEQQEEDKVCLATMEAFFNVLYYSELVDILSAQADNARLALSLAERQEELGIKGHADVVQMEADLADREYELATAKCSLSDARLTLEDVMFWPSDEELVIDTDLSALDDMVSVSAPASELIVNAQNFLPSVLVAKAQLENAGRRLSTTKWQFLPTLNLYGGWSTSYYTYPRQPGYTPVPYWNQFRNNGGEYVELSLSIPIYGRLQKYTKLSKAKNEYSRASLEYDKTLHDVEAEVKRAISDRDGAESALYQAEKRAAVQEEAYKLNVRRFEQGLISSIEFQTISSNYLKSQAEHLDAALKYQLKRRVVLYYSGIRYIDQ